ncbi:MAG: DnaJ domain-containing protein [Clostridia bacterium]|nr:DnaJ domain-containing protein [Clostridia bacterium]
MTDPYKVLGVSRDATDEDVKKAYRNLARKYHPDNYSGSDLADLAGEKMKEINEAYDQIQKERSGKGNAGNGSTGYGSTYGGYNAGTGYTGGNSAGGNYSGGAATLGRARSLINAGRYSEAGIVLDSIAQSARNAEWNYLKGCVLLQRGWYYDAQKYFEVACYMEPGNAEYQAALASIRNSAGQYGKTYQQTQNCSACDLCTGLACADCLCECCGGDLIRCC